MINQIYDTPKVLEEYFFRLLPEEAYVGERKDRSKQGGRKRLYAQAEAVIRSLKYESGTVSELALIQYTNISDKAVTAMMSMDVTKQKTAQLLRSIYICTSSDRYAHIYAGHRDARDIVKYAYTDEEVQLVRIQFDGRYISTQELKSVLEEAFLISEQSST